MFSTVLRAFANGCMSRAVMLKKMAACSSERVRKWLEDMTQGDAYYKAKFFRDLRKSMASVVKVGSAFIGFNLKE